MAGLLADPDLSHTARLVLESMAAPEAGLALMAGLDGTEGLIKAGLIHSLGRRRETRAVPALVRLLGDPDLAVAGAAAAALGRIADAPSVRSLRAVLSASVPGERRIRILDALLAAADRTLAEGRRDEAASLYETLLAAPSPAHIRSAAYRGTILSAQGTKAIHLVQTALLGGDASARTAALEAARESPGPAMTRALIDALAPAEPALKIALIEALRQRGDPAAGPALLALLQQSDRDVRNAALGGLGEIGDDRAVDPLLNASTSRFEDEARTARQALLVLHRGDVSRALIARLAGGNPAERIGAARALAGRGDHDAVPSLIEAAGTSVAPVRGALLPSVGTTGRSETDLPALLRLISERQGRRRPVRSRRGPERGLPAAAQPGSPRRPLPHRRRSRRGGLRRPGGSS